MTFINRKQPNLKQPQQQLYKPNLKQPQQNFIQQSQQQLLQQKQKQQLLQQQQIKMLQQQQLKNQRKIYETNSTILSQVRQVQPTTPTPISTTKHKYQTLTPTQINVECYNTFKEIYKNRVKQTRVESIINGEIITTHPDNIFVDTVSFEDPKFEDKCKLITKTLFPYQANSIKMLRQLELSEYYTTPNGEKIYSNGYLLRLPIGAGKSLVFTTLALLYREIPPKPIVVSTSGINISEDKMTQLKFYPFYYENVGYIVKPDGTTNENCVAVMKDYNQREKLTVIITHFHLIDQLLDYIKTDFVPALLNPQVTKISVATDPRNIDLNCNILIVPATPEIIARLSALSWEMPFTRVIVDDYTNMSGIEEYRQILATSTIFVSGSGFERDIDKIPPSYYTLRYVDVNKFSLVAKPEETSKGILRNNIITFNLIGAQNEFSIYKFINDIDEHCVNKYKLVASNLYDRIEKNGGKLLDYFTLNFVLKNYDKLNKSINLIMKDIESGKLDKNKVEWFLMWKDMINQKVKILQRNKDKSTSTSEIDNPIYNALFKPLNQIPQGIQPMIMQNCQVCGALPQEHKGWGLISCCCGSFFCSKCLKSMVTKDVIIFDENKTVSKELHSEEHYYCTVCHKFDPVYVSNSTRHKDINNIQTYHMIDEFMDNSDLKGHLHVDYYFKMFIEGFKPKYFDGKVIECEINKDIENINESNLHEHIEPLIPKDQLALNCIDRINECLKKLEIKPAEMNTIKPQLLIYGCPDYMQKRVEQYYKLYSSDKNENLYNLSILFKNNMSELIGLHQNIFGILVWNNPKNIDEIQQLIGRIVRLNNWNNPVYFYITCTGGVNVKGETVENVNHADNIENNDTLGVEISGGENMLDMLKGLKKEN